MVESRCGVLCSSCDYKEQMDCKSCVKITKPLQSMDNHTKEEFQEALRAIASTFISKCEKVLPKHQRRHIFAHAACALDKSVSYSGGFDKKRAG